MRPPLALVVGLFLASAALAAGPQADWRKTAGMDERVQAALTSQGWRLEADGRALDPKTKQPAEKAVLDKAVADLRQGARRAALEKVNLLLNTPKDQWDIADAGAVQAMSADLPPGLAAALADPNADPAKLRAMANSELATVAAYFDGSRTLADRQDAAAPVTAGTPAPRVGLPYFSAKEKAVGDKLRDAASTTIARDPFGKTVLARVNNDVPPIVIEEVGGSAIAQYDYRRRALVLDRALAVDSVVDTVPPRQRAALRSQLSTRDALIDYLNAHPDAVESIAKNNDVVFVHELTHAWQDKRDTVMREMAKGNVPEAQILEYEEEAYATKNLYIHSKLKNDPASVKMDDEFSNYILMTHGVNGWRQDLRTTLRGASPARALNTTDTQAIMAARIAAAKNKPVGTREEQQANALDLAAMKRGEKALGELKAANDTRIADLESRVQKEIQPEQRKLLVVYYLGQAEHASSNADRLALIDKASRLASASKDPQLIEAVRKAKERNP